MDARRVRKLGMNQQRLERPLFPDAVLEPGALRRGEIHRHTATLDKFFEESRIQRLNCIRPAAQEQMNMVTLRNSLSRLWLGRKRFAFQDRHPLGAFRQGACRQETSHARANDYSMSTGSRGGHGKDGSRPRGLNQASCRAQTSTPEGTADTAMLPKNLNAQGVLNLSFRFRSPRQCRCRRNVQFNLKVPCI